MMKGMVKEIMDWTMEKMIIWEILIRMKKRKKNNDSEAAKVCSYH